MKGQAKRLLRQLDYQGLKLEAVNLEALLEFPT
jgi:hypothetical protein